MSILIDLHLKDDSGIPRVYLEKVSGVNAPVARSVTRLHGESGPDQPGRFKLLVKNIRH